ncbi:MAG: dienelactone hydrolase family protein [Nitrospirae bacterium]|nr:dienelactone hydrolase family protein [Nitrospirota bacterium]
MPGAMVSFPSNGGTTHGYLATPKGAGPGVIVIQEWWGLVPHIKSVCDRLAAEGFTALAPDFYHGKTTTSPDEAGRLMMALNIAQAANDLKGAATFLLGHKATAGTRTVGVVGFCLGGQLALYAACENPTIGACVDFYGIHPNVKPRLAGLQSPVLGIFGEEDDSVTPAVVRKLEADLKKAGKTTDFTIFPNVGHAFFNDSRPDVYHKESARKAWQKTCAFLRQHLS